VADAYDAAPSVMEVLARPDTGITKPQQLEGKTIGTPEPQEMPFSATLPYSEETLATQSVLTTDGVSPSSVHWRAMPTDELVSALQNHQVSAILATEPTIYQAEIQLGAAEVLDSCSGQTASLPLAGYFTLGTPGRIPDIGEGGQPAAGRRPDVLIQPAQPAARRREHDLPLTGVRLMSSQWSPTPSSRAMIMRCTSEVPSPISRALASR
jgi:hypothetical protein